MTTMLCFRFGCRPVATVGGLLMFVGLLGAAFAPTLPVAYLTMGLTLGRWHHYVLQDLKFMS